MVRAQTLACARPFSNLFPFDSLVGAILCVKHDWTQMHTNGGERIVIIFVMLLAVVGSAVAGADQNEITRGPRGKSQIALTFDAGATAACFDDLIVALEKARVRSTFFITGNWARENKNCAQAI